MDLSVLLFWQKKLFATLALPPVLPLLPIALGLALLNRHPRVGRALAWAGVTLNLLLIVPASVGWLLAQVEDPAALAVESMADAEAIVILGAGRREYAPELGGETVNRLALERLRYGARLARLSGLPVLVSGGGGANEVPEAVLMQATLEQDFGVPVRWAEKRSLDTRGNARHCAAILDAAGVRRILLVTHAAHMPRARAEFEAAGLIVHAAPTGWLGVYADKVPANFLLGELPSQNSAYAGWFAWHETLGQLAYRISR